MKKGGEARNLKDRHRIGVIMDLLGDRRVVSAGERRTREIFVIDGFSQISRILSQRERERMKQHIRGSILLDGSS